MDKQVSIHKKTYLNIIHIDQMFEVIFNAATRSCLTWSFCWGTKIRLQLLQRDHIQDGISKETFRVGADLPDIYHACKLAHVGNVSSMEKRFMFSDSSFSVGQ